MAGSIPVSGEVRHRLGEDAFVEGDDLEVVLGVVPGPIWVHPVDLPQHPPLHAHVPPQVRGQPPRQRLARR